MKGSGIKGACDAQCEHAYCNGRYIAHDRAFEHEANARRDELKRTDPELYARLAKRYGFVNGSGAN